MFGPRRTISKRSYLMHVFTVTFTDSYTSQLGSSRLRVQLLLVHTLKRGSGRILMIFFYLRPLVCFLRQLRRAQNDHAKNQQAVGLFCIRWKHKLCKLCVYWSDVLNMITRARLAKASKCESRQCGIFRLFSKPCASLCVPPAEHI